MKLNREGGGTSGTGPNWCGDAEKEIAASYAIRLLGVKEGRKKLRKRCKHNRYAEGTKETNKAGLKKERNRENSQRCAAATVRRRGRTAERRQLRETARRKDSENVKGLECFLGRGGKKQRGVSSGHTRFTQKRGRRVPYLRVSCIPYGNERGAGRMIYWTGREGPRIEVEWATRLESRKKKGRRVDFQREQPLPAELRGNPLRRWRLVPSNKKEGW